MSEVKVDSIGPRVDSGTLTIGAAGDTVNIAGTAGTGFPTPTTGIAASAITTGTMATARLGSGTASSSTFLRGDQTYAAAGGENTPAFSAKLSGDQSTASGAETVLAFATEQWDTDSKYNTSTYRFTPTIAGKYVINGIIMLNDITVQNKRLQLLVYKNAGFFADVETIASSETSTDPTLSINLVMEFNTTDYVELRFYHNVGSAVTVRSGYSFFQGYKLIGA